MSTPSSSSIANALKPLMSGLEVRLSRIENLVTADLQTDKSDIESSYDLKQSITNLTSTVSKVQTQLDLVLEKLEKLTNENKEIKKNFEEEEEDM